MAHALNTSHPKAEMHHGCTALSTARMQRQSCKTRAFVLQGQPPGARVQAAVTEGVGGKFRQLVWWWTWRWWWIWGINRSLATGGTLVIALSVPFGLILAWTVTWQCKRVPFYPLHSRRVFLAQQQPPPQPLFPKCSLHTIGRTETHHFSYGFFNKATPGHSARDPGTRLLTFSRSHADRSFGLCSLQV